MIAIVIGGCYGSEGKGKAAVHFAKKAGCSLAVRTGSINAGHVAYINGHRHVCRMLPSLVAIPEAKLALGPGAIINVEKLHEEINTIEGEYHVPVRDRLIIDPDAAIMPDDAAEKERFKLELGEALGSTQTGCGWAASMRCLRKVKFAKDLIQYQDYLQDVPNAIFTDHMNGRQVIIEGTQGFGLSMFHGRNGKFCTSRDTSAAAFASEAGVSPMAISEIIMVIRTWPIRVGGNSGPMHMETTWDEVRKYSGHPADVTEMTSVTKKVRRVGRFDWDLFEQACIINMPTQVAIHGIDYLDYNTTSMKDFSQLPDMVRYFVARINSSMKMSCDGNVTMLFNGPHQDDVIDVPVV